VIVALVLILACVAPSTSTAQSERRRVGGATWLVIIPVALVFAFSIVRAVYFPMRFESLIAIPLVLWIARSRRIFAFALAAIGAIVCAIGIADHLHRPPDPYRVAAAAMRDHVRGPVVASGYLYLESVSAIGADRVEAFPREQGVHPGWRATISRDELRRESRALERSAFVWIGERAAPELPVLCESRTCRPLYANAHAIIVAMARRQ